MSRSINGILVSVFLLIGVCLCANHTVYLDRPANAFTAKGTGIVQKEPVFNPNQITANIGDIVEFVARFENQISFTGVPDTNSARGLIRRIMYRTGGRFQKQNTNPRHAVIIKVPQPSNIHTNLSGFFSGYFTVDPLGSGNASSFTLTVADSNPHFFYMVTSYYAFDCGFLGTWSSQYSFGPAEDVLFALNPARAS